MKTVIIGAGQGCQAVMDLVVGQRLTTLSLEIAGVVDADLDAPGMVFAREQNWPTFTDMYAALQMPGLELVIELTGLDAVREEIFARVPPRVRVMDHYMARVFWDLDEVAQHLLDELEQRIRLEMDIREDQRRLQEILDSLPDAVMVLDDEARIERVNRRYEEITGLRKHQIEGKPCFDVAAMANAGVACNMNACPRKMVLTTGQPVTVIQEQSCLGRACSENDGACYYEVTANRITDRRGKISVVVTSREVTDQVLLKRATEQAARRFDQILDTVHGLITIRDFEGKYQLANPAASRFFGIEAEAFGGHTHHELFPSEVADVFQRNDEAVIASGLHTTDEEIFVLHDREYVLLTERVLLMDYKQEPVAICSVARNVTETRRMQQELVQTEKHAAVGKLAGGVAHELNNPLTGVLTFTEELLEDVEEGSQMAEDLQVILRETLRCRQIVRDLLDFSRQGKPNRQALSLEAVIRRTLNLVQKQPAFHDIHFEVDLADGMLVTRGDPNQLQQVLLNLVINARDAMNGNGTIRLRTRPPDGGKIAIEVIDHGVGISVDNQARIFEPFYSTKGVQGNGLGLAAVRNIIERHGGEIALKSTPGQGSIFKVLLPSHEEDDVNTTRGFSP
jgi:two-component system, NtrC family, sensor kinase